MQNSIKGVVVMSKKTKAQSAMEYLMTYGWAILIIAVVLGALFSLGVFSGTSLMGTSCIASPGYYCQNPTLSAKNNQLTFTFGQNTGTTIYNAVLYVAPQGSAVNNYGFPTQVVSNSIGTLYSGQTVTPIFYSISSLVGGTLSIGTPFTGYVWLNYSTTSNGPTSSAKVATITVKAS